MGMFDWLSPTAGADQGNMGLMGMLANPQTAGLLGMAGGLLSAAGPSRLPVNNGMALGAGFQGMQQGIGNAIQNQRGMMMMRALGNAMGPDSSGQPAPQAPPLPAVTGGANNGPMSGLSAGMGNAAPTPQAAASSAQGAYPASDPQSILAQYYQKLNVYALAGLPTTGIETEMKYDPRLAYAMPTPQMINTAAAYGQGTPESQAALRGMLTKDMLTAVRPGGGIFNSMTNQMTMTPGANGVMQIQDPSSPTGWRTMLNPGATGAAQQEAGAQAAGKATYDLAPVWQQDPQTGQWVQVNQTRLNVANAANGAGAAGAATPASAAVVQTESGGNPNAVSPKGAQGAWQVMPNTQANPGFGVTPAQNNSRAELDRVGQDYYNAMVGRYAGNPTIGAIAYNMGPGATDTWIKNGANWEALPPETRNYVGKVSTLTALNGGSGAPQSSAPASPRGGPMLAAPPIGAQTSIENTAKDNAGNYNNLSQFASASPDRVNTLDNMMALAQGTTKFGPGWEGRLDRMAQINSYLPSGMAFGSDAASNAQTFQKYASYLVQQYQRAMGGHQTDAQLNTVIHGTPNPEMLNQTMTEVIPKLKAMELAVQSKATAADNWMAQHGNNASNYNQFESTWRQNYDPRIYQMQQMDLPTRAQFMKSQPDANALRAKVATALQNGWVQ